MLTQSTNGTSATTARQRSGRIEYTAPWSSPPADTPAGHDPAAVHERRPAAAGEPVGHGDVVGERRRLGPQPALLPPPPPALAATADVGDRVDDAAVEQRRQAAVELRDRRWPRRRRTRRAGTGALPSSGVVARRRASVTGIGVPSGAGRADALGPVGRRVVPGDLPPLEQLPAPRCARSSSIPGAWLDQGLLDDDHRAAVVVLGVVHPIEPAARLDGTSRTLPPS